MQNETSMYEMPADRLVFTHKGLGEGRDLGMATVVSNMWGKPRIHILLEGRAPRPAWVWPGAAALALAAAVAIAWYVHAWPFSAPHAGSEPPAAQGAPATPETPAAVPAEPPVPEAVPPTPDAVAPTPAAPAAPVAPAPAGREHPQEKPPTRHGDPRTARDEAVKHADAPAPARAARHDSTPSTADEQAREAPVAPASPGQEASPARAAAQPAPAAKPAPPPTGAPAAPATAPAALPMTGATPTGQ